MKKLLVLVLAIAGLVACTQETTLVQKGNAPMEFGGAFVEYATRADKAEDPSITTANITGFDVWGFMDSAEGVVFMDEDVTGSQGNFTYVNTQYWAPGHNYYFAALAPVNSPNVTETLASGEAAKLGLGTIKFNVTDGAEDLLYSAVGPIAAPAANATTVEPVKFQFNHMLSKVKFSFTNGFDNDNAYIDVKNIKMVVPETGTIDLAVADWWSKNMWVLGDTTKEIAFGDACDRTKRNGYQESADERIILPADATQKYTVTFDVVLYQGTVEAYKGTKTVTIENVALEIGKAYNFKAELNASNIMADGTELLPIVFDVEEVKDWVTAEKPDVNVQEAELRAALLLGGEVTLTEDLVITESLVVAADASSVINLNGFNIINNTTSEELGVGDGIVVYGDLVINGNGTVKGKTRSVWARGNDNPTVTINGGNYVGAVGGSQCEVIYASGNGVITINGGTFEAQTQDTESFAAPQYAVLNIHGNGATGCDIVVYGGSFKNFDPANNISENPAKNFCAPGYFSTKIGDYYVVADAQVVATAEEFAEALKADAENIAVKLAGDLDVAISSLGQQTGGSGEYKLGGENTKNITIDLNGKKLNITTTYWSNLGAKNNDAVFTIKNGTMTSSQPTGTWNSYDLTFSNCNYVIEDVVFEKAIALAATGKSASLKNVTIKESHDYYAMWVRAAGLNVTADNLTVESAGRGIKIDEQYIDALAKVTLTVKNSKFTTAKKAAIVVKSAAGAEINVEDIDIAGVAADAVNAVWVDADSAAYYDLVTVNGATKKQE